MKDFRDKVAFITGAASGIGFGLARACAAEGMKVALADVRREALREAVRTLTAQGGTALAVPLDVTERAAWELAAATVARELGPVQILCSNAGVNLVGATAEATFEDWD
ncbi:MAG: SDR family NAD(P)-dependent oxidoreductase, partial [Steroidobacteraceae bacterium]